MSGTKSVRLFCCLSAHLALCASRCSAQGITTRYLPLPRDVIQKRLLLVSRDDSERERIIKILFHQAGCDDEHLTEQLPKRTRVPNLICTQVGTGDGIIIVGGHTDHAREGRGVVDDWAGVALLPSLFQSLRDEPRKHTFVFVGFASEEKGLVGSRFYVNQLKEEQVTRIRAMVNLECLGLSPVEVWGHHADPLLLKMYGYVAHNVHLPFVSANMERAGDDDADSFRGRKVPTITIHSVTQETLSILHSPRDDFQAVDWDAYYDSYRLIVAYLAFLDQTLD